MNNLDQNERSLILFIILIKNKIKSNTIEILKITNTLQKWRQDKECNKMLET
jgi:hypothetical protein